MSSFDKAVAQNTKNFLGLNLWLVHMSKPTSFDEMQPLVAEHIDYALRLERDHVLFGAGPLSDDDGNLDGRGLFIIRAESRADAENIAKNDPIVKSGVRKFSIERWTLNVGSVQHSIRYSSQSVCAF